MSVAIAGVPFEPYSESLTLGPLEKLHRVLLSGKVLAPGRMVVEGCHIRVFNLTSLHKVDEKGAFTRRLQHLHVLHGCPRRLRAAASSGASKAVRDRASVGGRGRQSRDRSVPPRRGRPWARLTRCACRRAGAVRCPTEHVRGRRYARGHASWTHAHGNPLGWAAGELRGPDERWRPSQSRSLPNEQPPMFVNMTGAAPTPM
jgi:hypothetical protein